MNDQIINSIQQIVKKRGDDPVYLFDAEVKSVNKNKRTCEVIVINGDTQNTLTARLMSSLDDGFLMTPTVDSTVTIIVSKEVSALVVMMSEIDEIILRGGDKKGLVVLDDLVSRLNNIEDDINEIKQVFTAWAPALGDGGGALKAAAAVWSSALLTNTVASDIENTKITQG